MASVRAFAMLSATGSAICAHTGVVAVAHCSRVNVLGVAVSSGTEVASSSHRAATWNAWSVACAVAGSTGCWPSRAMAVARSAATVKSMPSPPDCAARCSWPIRFATNAGSFGSPAAPASCDGSICPSPESSLRSISWKSSSGPGCG